MFASASFEIKFNHWPTKDEEFTFKPQVFSEIRDMSLSKNNDFFAFATNNGTAEIVSLADPTTEHVLPIRDVSALVFERSNAKNLCVATFSGKMLVYDATENVVVNTFGSASYGPLFVDFNSGDKILASGASGGITLHETTGYDTQVTHLESRALTALKFHPEKEEMLVLGFMDGSMSIRDVAAETTELQEAQLHSDRINSIAFSQKMETVLTGGNDGKFHLYDIIYGECILRKKMPVPVSAVNFNADGTIFGIGTDNGEVSIYDIRNMGQAIFAENVHKTQIRKLLFENDFKVGKEVEILTPVPSEPIIQKNDAFEKNLNVEPDFRFVEIRIEDRHIDFKPTLLSGSKKENRYKRVSAKKKIENDSASQRTNKEVTDSILRGSERLHTHLMEQFNSLHTLIVDEFRTVDEQMDENWNRRLEQLET